MKNRVIYIFVLLFFLCLQLNKTHAQNWFPMEVGNKWQYLGHFENTGLNQEYYFLRTYEIVDSIIFGNVKYFKWSLYPEYGFRINQADQKIIILAGSQEHLFMDFTVPQDSFVYRFEPEYGQYINCRVYGYDFNFIDSTLYKKGYIISDEISQSTYYSIDLGLVSSSASSNNWMWGPMRSRNWLIQATINGVNYSSDYFPEIIFEPFTEISNPEIQFTIEVNHFYNYLAPTFNNKLNFIDSVYIHQFYSKNGNVVGNSTLQAYNESNTPNWVFNADLDTNLLNNHYQYNFRIEAIDKGLSPRRSFAPDTGYFIAVMKNTSSFEEPVNSFTLFQNYPNPFNSTTNIKYQIPESGFVSLKVYDVLGSEVVTLFNEGKPAGSYEIKFDGSSLPSGVYFYQLKSGSFVETKKMVFMK